MHECCLLNIEMLFELLVSVPAAIAAGYIGIKLFCPWLLLDFKYLIRVIPCVAKYESMLKKKTFVLEHFERAVKRSPDHCFLLYEDQRYTYKQANALANKIARTLLSLGLQKGDTVALLQYNCPEYVWTFLGGLKSGIRISLINTNLRGKALKHCISVSDANTVLVGCDEELISAVDAILPDLPDNAAIYVLGSPSATLPPKFVSLQSKLNDASADDIDAAAEEPNAAAVFIFTSGTTGLPKAATVSHRRLLASYNISSISGFCPEDVVYITLPLYHSSGLIVGLCGVICKGATCALGKKFSKSRFWDDIRRHKVSVFIYIGEMCRYLLTNDKTDQDKDHGIRLALGNGLRQDIFAEFKERFGIPWICEFYASTEAVTGFMNITNVVGACGRSSPLLERFVSCGLYQWDVENECLVRDKKGLCVPVKLGKPGLLLMEINRTQTYDGYKGAKEQSEKKVIRNVRKDGDIYFNSGDLMSKDRYYSIYFNDRIGDTYRWKSENVSTTEVSNLLTEVSFIIDAAVYGVAIPGCDGRAGMATLLIQPDVKELNVKELGEISQHCGQVLPAYAIPLFLRLKWEELDMTSTIKQSKVKLKQEGFDYWLVGDPMFYYERQSGTYKELTKEAYEDIMNQTIRF